MAAYRNDITWSGNCNPCSPIAPLPTFLAAATRYSTTLSNFQQILYPLQTQLNFIYICLHIDTYQSNFHIYMAQRLQSDYILNN